MATIRKRGNKYQAQIRRNGYPDISKSFYLRRDAKEWSRTMELQADRGELSPNRQMLKHIALSELVIRYRDEVVSKKKCSVNEAGFLNVFLRHSICKQRLSDLSTADFAAYRDERLNSVTAKSFKRMLSPVHNMFEIARDEWGIQTLPLLTTVDNRHVIFVLKERLSKETSKG